MKTQLTELISEVQVWEHGKIGCRHYMYTHLHGGQNKCLLVNLWSALGNLGRCSTLVEVNLRVSPFLVATWWYLKPATISLFTCRHTHTQFHTFWCSPDVSHPCVLSIKNKNWHPKLIVTLHKVINWWCGSLFLTLPCPAFPSVWQGWHK